METKRTLRDEETRGTCPVCGTSWMGPTFAWIYSDFLRRDGHAEVTQQELDGVLRRHKETNQSRLLEPEDDARRRMCPDCKTIFAYGG